MLKLHAFKHINPNVNFAVITLH